MLASHGARNFAFISTSGGSKDEARDYISWLRAKGCKANAYACDISNREELAAVLARCNSEMPPIKGLIQCAMSLRVSFNLPFFPLILCWFPFKS